MKKIVLLGASVLARKVLSRIAEETDFVVTGIVTAPKKFSISYSPTGVTNSLYSDLAAQGEELGVPSVLVEGSMNTPSLFALVESWKPDLFLVAGWYHHVPSSWRQLAPAYGFHASLLPRYRGGAPLVWALINGEHETGITLFRLDDGVDTGPVFGQRKIDILPEETIASLYPRVVDGAVDILDDFLRETSARNPRLNVQDERLSTVYPQRSPADGLIDWNQPGNFITRFVRAQTKPYPGAFTLIGERKLTIWEAKFEQDHPREISARGGAQEPQPPAGFRCLDGVIVPVDFDLEPVGVV